jgi:hypothetical protein
LNCEKKFTLLKNEIIQNDNYGCIVNTYTYDLNTTIKFPYVAGKMQELEDNFVSLKVYDLLGREVISLQNNYMKRGIYSKEFTASGLASGIYLYRLQAGEYL